jgi:hypothetical protein
LTSPKTREFKNEDVATRKAVILSQNCNFFPAKVFLENHSIDPLITLTVGEPQFLETMQLKYSEQAEQNGVFVVGSCGFDSIPSDLGGVAVHKAMAGPVNKVRRIFSDTRRFFK